jgi:hypothetical protein
MSDEQHGQKFSLLIYGRVNHQSTLANLWERVQMYTKEAPPSPSLPPRPAKSAC